MLCYLDNQPVPYINSSLKSTVDVSQAVCLKANLDQCFQGVIPVGKGFVTTESQVNDWIKADSKNQEVLKLFSMGANLAQEVNGKPERWIIDFNDMSLEDASDYKQPFDHVKSTLSQNAIKIVMSVPELTGGDSYAHVQIYGKRSLLYPAISQSQKFQSGQSLFPIL
jgi:hypothetical protein